MKVQDIIRMIKEDGRYRVATKGSHRQYYSAYSPELTGCVATGESRKEMERNVHEAVQMHVQGLREDNLPILKSQSFAEYIAV